mmetsp:Transcript_59923/g.129944  ORF Transcript_59923/g.129944 Transcript_59923/m.129944 type:complete len:298 (-) Transcript_59923:162-1055(-)
MRPECGSDALDLDLRTSLLVEETTASFKDGLAGSLGHHRDHCATHVAVLPHFAVDALGLEGADTRCSSIGGNDSACSDGLSSGPAAPPPAAFVLEHLGGAGLVLSRGAFGRAFATCCGLATCGGLALSAGLRGLVDAFPSTAFGVLAGAFAVAGGALGARLKRLALDGRLGFALSGLAVAIGLSLANAFHALLGLGFSLSSALLRAFSLSLTAAFAAGLRPSFAASLGSSLGLGCGAQHLGPGSCGGGGCSAADLHHVLAAGLAGGFTALAATLDGCLGAAFADDLRSLLDQGLASA